MARTKVDKDFRLLTSTTDFFKGKYKKDISRWKGSKLEWILFLPSRTKGKLGAQLIQQICALNDISTDKSPDSQADCVINGHRVEIKLSTLWETGIYKFQQLRDQNYEYAICLGISPFEAHCWIISKDILKKHVIGHTGQHTGSTGKDTAWFAVIPNNPPDWLRSCGGTIDQAVNILRKIKHIK